jgi:hypothetical protein
VSHTLGFAFVANPKAASTSVDSALATFQERPDLNEHARTGFYTRRHIAAVDLRDALGSDEWGRMFTFGLVRNPFDWLTSQITYNRRRIGMAVPFDRALSERDVHMCYDLLRDRRGQSASATGSQWAFLCHEDQHTLVTQVFALERLVEDWPAITRAIGVIAPEPDRLNTTDHPSWDQWLTESAKQLTRTLWARDFELYAEAKSARLR